MKINQIKNNIEIKVDSKTCVKEIDGHCKLKIKDKPTSYSKVDICIGCCWYKKGDKNDKI